MSAERISTKSKIRILIFSFALFSILLYTSQAINLNDKAQRALSQILETPERFFIQTLDRFQELENREIAKLKKEILGLQDSIYEKDLQIKSLENSRSYTPYSSNEKNIYLILDKLMMEYLLYLREILLLEKPEYYLIMRLKLDYLVILKNIYLSKQQKNSFVLQKERENH